jgi:hypothetical protein
MTRTVKAPFEIFFAILRKNFRWALDFSVKIGLNDRENISAGRGGRGFMKTAAGKGNDNDGR